MSCTIKDPPMTAPASSTAAERVEDTSTSVPSLRRQVNSCRSVSAPEASHTGICSAHSSRCSSGATIVTV